MTNRAIIQARKIDLLLKLISLITSMGSSPTVKKSVASFLVPLYSREPRRAIRVRGFSFYDGFTLVFIPDN